jgi:AcrR family transcriptional regulator
VPVKTSGRRRLSRTEAQAETRRRLLDAAEDAFAAEGFAGASLERIAEAAGYSRGAVYSNFGDKADLFVAVLERRLARRTAEVAEAAAGAGGMPEFVAGLRIPAWSSPQRGDDARRWILLHDEFRLYALRNPEAAKRLARHERRQRRLYTKAAAHLLGRLGVAPPVDPGLVGALIFAVDESLPRQRFIDPGGVPATALADALSLLLAAAVALADAEADAGADAGADAHAHTDGGTAVLADS